RSHEVLGQRSLPLQSVVLISRFDLPVHRPAKNRRRRRTALLVRRSKGDSLRSHLPLVRRSSSGPRHRLLLNFSHSNTGSRPLIRLREPCLASAPSRQTSFLKARIPASRGLSGTGTLACALFARAHQYKTSKRITR